MWMRRYSMPPHSDCCVDVLMSRALSRAKVPACPESDILSFTDQRTLEPGHSGLAAAMKRIKTTIANAESWTIEGMR